MLDIKAIRENPAEFKRTLGRKGVDASRIDMLLDLDKTYRTLLQVVEELSAKQNEVSKKMPQSSGDEKPPSWQT